MNFTEFLELSTRLAQNASSATSVVTFGAFLMWSVVESGRACIYIHLNIYIYIQRERERESEHTLFKPISHPIFFLYEFARRQLLELSELLEPSGAAWSHLDSSLAIWRCLDLSGAIWRHLEVSGPTWSHLEVSGASWSLPGPSGAMWSYMETSVPFCSRLKLHGLIWGLSGRLSPYVIVWFGLIVSDPIQFDLMC